MGVLVPTAAGVGAGVGAGAAMVAAPGRAWAVKKDKMKDSKNVANQAEEVTQPAKGLCSYVCCSFIATLGEHNLRAPADVDVDVSMGAERNCTSHNWVMMQQES